MKSIKEKLLAPTIYGDIPTFLGVPRAETKKDLEAADAAIIGIPYAPLWSPGMWPKEPPWPLLVRRASLGYGGYLPALDIDIFEYIKLVDYGDVSGHPVITNKKDLFTAMNQTEKKVKEVIEAGCIPITIGGSNYSVIKAIAEKTKGKVGVINLDAHGDNLEEYYGNKWCIEMCWVTRSAEIENVDMKKWVQIGMSTPACSREAIEWYKKKGSHLYTRDKIKKMGIEAVAKESIRFSRDGTKGVWLCIDFDILDIGAAPGLIEPLGLRRRSAYASVWGGKKWINGLYHWLDPFSNTSTTSNRNPNNSLFASGYSNGSISW